MANLEVSTSGEFEFEGFWWEPPEGDEEPEPVQGRLNYKPDSGATLTVVDWHPNSDIFDEPRRVPVIHGHTLADEPCSLFDAFPRDRVGYGLVGGHSREEWHSNQLIYGAHVDDPDAFKVQRVRVKVRGLREWLFQPWHGPQGGQKGVGIEPGYVEIPLEGATLTLGLSQARSHQPFVEHHEIWASAQFDLNEPMTLPDFKERYSGPFHDLILFATHEETRIEAMTSLIPEEVEKWWGAEEERTIPTQREIEIVERTQIQPLRPRNRPYQHMLLPYAALGENAADPIRRWFGLRAKLAGAGDALFSTINVRYIYLENQLLNLMSFAEAYHRTLHDQPLVDAETHAEAIKAMLASLDDQRLQEIYAKSLEHADEPSQAMRLRALFELAEPVLDEAKRWRQKLVHRMVVTRNYLTHWAEWSKAVLEGRDRWLAAVRLQVVIEMNLMLNLGMEKETIEACIRNAYMGHQALREKP